MSGCAPGVRLVRSARGQPVCAREPCRGGDHTGTVNVVVAPRQQPALAGGLA